MLIYGGKNYKAPGRIWLLVTGIIYIVIYSFWLLVTVPLTACVACAVGLVGTSADSILAELYILIALASSIFGFVIGILGVVHRNNISKANLLFNLAMTHLIIDIVGIVFFFSIFSILTIAFLALPICYMIGANKNRVFKN
jgi:hypothetical protein